MSILTVTDITARLSVKAYSRLYAKDGGASADGAYAALIVAEAESVVRMLTAAAFPDGLDAAGGSVDPAIVGAAVDIANELAAGRHPAASEHSGYFMAGQRARSYLRALSRDNGVRSVVTADGRSRPRAVVRNTTDDSGTPTSVYSRVSDGRDRSGF